MSSDLFSDENVDRHLDAVLKASGSALAYYSLRPTKESMREAVREAMRDAMDSTLAALKKKRKEVAQR